MILVYSFRTFPWIKELQKYINAELFIFGKLGEDFERFCQEVKLKQPEWVIGMAKGRSSQWESLAINKFNNGKIVKGGVEEYKLYVSDGFPLNQIPRATFCNWTAYKIQDFLVREKVSTKLSFIHISKEGLEKLADGSIIKI